MKFKALVTASCLIMAGCGSANSDGSRSPNSTATSEITIQGMKPEDYYSQFVAKVTGDCSKHSIYFHYTDVRSVLIAKNVRGRDVRAEFDIYLRADHTYAAYYSELDIYEYTDLGYKYNVTYQETLTGSWKVDGSAILFSNLGKGTSLQYNNSPAIEIQFNRDVKTPGLRGKIGLARQVMSSSGDQSEEEYCAMKR